MQISFVRYVGLLWKYISPQKLKTLILAIFLLLTMVIQLINPQIIGNFIDSATEGEATGLLIRSAVVFIAFVIISQLTYASANYLGEDVGWTATNLLRIDLAKHCLALDMSFFKQHTPGEMIERIEGDVNTLANFLSKSAVTILINLLLLIGVLILLIWEDWRIGLFAIGFTIVSGIVLYRVRGVAVPHIRSLRKIAADLSGFTEEQLSSVEDITANGATPYVMNRFFQLLRKHLYHFRIAHIMSRVFTGTMEIGLAFAAAMTLTIGGVLYKNGQMSLGSIYMTFFYTQLLGSGLQTLIYQFTDIQIATASIQRINELFDTHSQIIENPINTISEGKVTIAFRGVQFGYESDQTVFPDLTFTLEAGQTLGLLGRTGSGKTSLTRLLFRLYDPRKGTIEFNGTDIRTVALESLRNRIGLVTQDVQLMRGTIRDNLTFYDPGFSDADMEKVLDNIGLTEWYKSFPEGLGTEIVPQSLSAGEAQLLALARVFLRNPDIVVLDEASSRLDPVTERLLDKAIQLLLAERTGIIIAHRLETIHKVDNVLILENGQISEFGARRELALNPQSRLSHLLDIGMVEVLS